MPRLVRAAVVLIALLLPLLAAAQAEEGAKPFVPNGRWALVVGVSGYSDAIGPLRYPAKEAREFSRALTGDLGFAGDNVRLLADGGQSPVAPTAANILGALDALLADPRLDRANLFVFYFSGHGVATPEGDFLLPADATKDRIEEMGVPVREVVRKVVAAGLKNVLFVADACRAGTENDFGADLTALCHQANLAVLLGCAPGKRSYEYEEFEQGAFTHFLLEGLHRPELRDASGALWASRLGEEVQKQVHDYTEPDHGKFAQVPSLWAERSTLDVLLAAYPQPPVSDAAVARFQAKARQLDRKDYAAAMIAYAAELYDKDRTDGAVEMLKTVDALGELTPEARFTLATALSTLGRTGEAERVSAAFGAMPKGLWHDLGVASSVSRDVAPAERLQAALAVFAATDDWTFKLLAYDVVARFGSPEGKLALAKRLVADAKTPRAKLYGASQVAYDEGRWDDAIRALDDARKSPGDAPADLVLYLGKISPLIAKGDPKTLDAFYDEGLALPRRAAFAWLGKAQLAKDRGDRDARVAALRTALKSDPSGSEIFLAAKIAGPSMRVLAEDFKAAGERQPYSWRARLALAVVAEIAGGKSTTDALAADRYFDDRLTFNAARFDLMESALAEAVGLGLAKIEGYRSQIDFFFLMLKDDAARFGYDAELWHRFIQYGMLNDRTAQVNAVVAARLRFPTASAPKDLKPILLLLAMDRGDEAAATRTFQGAFEATERNDPAWFYAAYEASLGRPKAAAARIAGLALPSPELATRMEALKTYLLAATGHPDAARQRLSGTSDDAVVDAFRGLAWAEMGDWARAEPLLREQSEREVWAYLFLQAAAVRRLDARYRATGRAALCRDLAFSASVSQPGNPLFDRLAYAPKPTVAAYAGAVAMDAGTVDDRDPNLSGRLSFAVSTTGAFAGRFQAPEAEPLRLTGTVDAYGNLRGTGLWHGKRYALAAKLAPAGLYKTYPKFRTVGGVFQLVDPAGVRIVVLGRTKA